MELGLVFSTLPTYAYALREKFGGLWYTWLSFIQQSNMDNVYKTLCNFNIT